MIKNNYKNILRGNCKNQKEVDKYLYETTNKTFKTFKNNIFGSNDIFLLRKYIIYMKSIISK